MGQYVWQFLIPIISGAVTAGVVEWIRKRHVWERYADRLWERRANSCYSALQAAWESVFTIMLDTEQSVRDQKVDAFAAHAPEILILCSPAVREAFQNMLSELREVAKSASTVDARHTPANAFINLVNAMRLELHVDSVALKEISQVRGAMLFEVRQR